MTIAISGTNGITLDGQFNSASSFGFKNRIINGAMVIDQRNAGASVTPSNQYVLDRWYYGNSQASKGTIQQNAASVTPPTGFSSYLGFTSSSAYSVLASDEFFIRQPIEGFNSSDLAFGSASATSITLSFWVRSSLAGTFAGVFKNSAQNRSYPFTYTISSANTWEQKTVTIVGDTSGTWIGGTNGVGLYVVFALGVGSSRSGTAGSWQGIDVNSATGATSVVGTNGATFYITGVQLEKGSTATSFDYRPYGTELQLCQRYFEMSYDIGTVPATATSVGSVGNYFNVSSNQTGYMGQNILHKVTKRATSPTLTFYDIAGTSGKISVHQASGALVNNVAYTGVDQNGTNGFMVYTTGYAGGMTGFQFHYTVASEL